MDAYHHGDLRQALIDATESLLAERGAEGFSLREVARRAGVSPAAPAHHFGDAAGLLTAVVTLAFEGLTGALLEGEARGGDEPRARLREQGVGYVEFAMKHPGRFRLMFRGGLLHDSDELARHAHAAFGALEGGVRALYAVAPARRLSARQWSTLIATWSLVHGYAHLAIAGRFDKLAGDAGRAAFVRDTVRPVLAHVIDGVEVPVGRKSARKRSTQRLQQAPRK